MPYSCHILDVTENKDDFPLLQHAARGIEGVIVERAESARGTLSHLESRNHRPNLILMGWTMPNIAGADLLRLIKGNATSALIPVIVIAVGLVRDDVELAYSLGASCVMERQLDSSEFQKSLCHLFQFWGTIARLPFC